MKKFLHGDLFFRIIILGIIAMVFRNWIINPEIIGGDWPYYYEDFLKDFSLRPFLWGPWLGNGMGGINPLLGLGMFSSLLVVPFSLWLHIPWVVVYKIGWFGLYLVAAVISSRKLLKTINPQISQSALAIGSLVYTTNTYILMLTGGGQMGIALAYGLVPWVLSLWIQLITGNNKKLIVHSGLAFAVILVLDPRVAFITAIAIIIYFIFRFNIKNVIPATCAGLLALLLCSFWLVPIILMRSNPLETLGNVYTSTEAVKFFSFADFPHAFSLLHPNWPENIFGKVYFLQPVFLIIPLLAFSALVKKERSVTIFALLALVGIFLAKGANEPLDTIYLWLFDHVPGFVMFRDPTKFYILSAISYTVLIAFVIDRFRTFSKLTSVFFVIFWSFTIRQALSGSLGGTFASRAVPQDYVELSFVLHKDAEFSRTLWAPRQSRFTYTSLNHLPIEAGPLYEATSPGELKARLQSPDAATLLSDMGVGYIMVPYDPYGELFVKDRRYDEDLRKEYERVLDAIPWLIKIQTGAISVYKTPYHRDLFSFGDQTPVVYLRQTDNSYTIFYTAPSADTLYYSQQYNPGWKFDLGSAIIQAKKTPSGLIAFPIPTAGTFKGTVFFEPQKYVDWGVAISVVTIMLAAVVLVVFKRV